MPSSPNAKTLSTGTAEQGLSPVEKLRAAADDGAPQLYATLFGRPNNHRNNKNGKAAAPAEATPAPTTPAAGPTRPA